MEKKEKYIREFIICCLESSTLDEYYHHHIGKFIKDFKSLYDITMYFIKKKMVVCYRGDEILSESESEKFLINQKNWSKIPNNNELVLIEETGFDYFNQKIYENEIEEGKFPNFEII